jgi:hypothetical protein
MASKEEIKKAILDVAGHPETGPIRELLVAWADAIVAIDAPAPAPVVEREDAAPVKETRVLNVAEKR